jgi:hypothetical protein
MLGGVSKRHSNSVSAASLGDLAATVGHEREALLQAVAALQLIPDNAAKWIRFERLLEVAAGAPPAQEQLPISPARLRTLLTQPPIASSQMLSQEDPFEEPFIAAITFYGGTFRVVMGGASGANAGCQLVIEAARTLTGGALDDYRLEVLSDAQVLLTLSELMCARAGLVRWAAAAHSPRTSLVIPGEEELRRLALCATFADDDLQGALGALAPHVDELIAPGPLGMADHEQYSPTDDRSYLYPLAELRDDNVLVALPGGIAASITHRALARAVKDRLDVPVVQALHEANLRTAHRYLDRVRWHRITPPVGLNSPTLFRDAFYRFDVDKVAHVVSIVDPLENYAPGHPFDSGDFGPIESELHARFGEARTALRANRPVSVLHLLVTAPLGRSSIMGFRDQATDTASELLSLTTDDLDLLTGLEAPEPLGLWRFASAVGRLHERSRVMSFSAIDDYAIYRDNDCSFYLSDNPPPDLLTVAPGSGADLRTRERQRLDQHAAKLPHRDAVAEVARWPADDATPIYRPIDPPFSPLHLVELNAPCWVVPKPDTDEEMELSSLLAETVAFWLWRCSEMLRPALDPFQATCLTVETRFANPTPGGNGGEPAIVPSSSWMTCVAAEDRQGVRLTLLDGAGERLVGPGNAAERAIAGELVAAIFDLAETPGAPLPEAVSASLPDGPMRMLQAFDTDDDLMFVFGYTAMPRLVSGTDVEALLDEVGAMVSRIGFDEGSIPGEDRTSVLNTVVTTLVERLRDRLVALNPLGLLEHLAAEQESLIYLEARNRLLIPSQAACFGEDSSALRRAIASTRDVTTTSIANRFLIEFVTAISPTGDGVLSVGRYDEMIALASQIVQFGYLSDAIHYELSSTQLAVLPSGRLGTSRDEPYHQAIESYASRQTGRALEIARSVFANHWRGPSADDEAFDPTGLNEAFKAEFGVTVTEMSQISGDLMELARNEVRQIAVHRLDELVALLETRESWPAEKVRSALALLSLRPLSEFPPATNPADCYPWRFSRDRSATRRPLLLRTQGSEVELIWGPRAVYRSNRYLFDLLHADRLVTRSRRMKEYVTSLRQEANERFQHQVASLYREVVPDVREKVKRIGRLKLARASGDEIGDIDVLVIDDKQKVLVAVEVKDFELARTPAELSNEMKKLFDGPKSASHHHQERLEFLKSNRERVHSELKLAGSAKEWQIRGEIVTSHDLLAAQFPLVRSHARPLNIVHFDELVARAQSGRLVRRVPDSTARGKRRRR